MSSAITKLFWISRPVSWPNTAFPFAAAYIMTGGQINELFWIATIFFLIPYNLLMYGVNDVYDYESDIKNPRKGGIEGMREQRSFHPTILKASIITTVPFLGYLFLKGDLFSNIVLATIVLFVVAYSLAGLRFKEIPVLDSITSSIHFVGPMIYGLVLTGIDVSAVPYIASFFLWGCASHAFGAVQDVVPDRLGSLKSIATVFGARATVRLAVILYTLASLILIPLNIYAALIGLIGLIYVLNIISYINISDQRSAKTNKAWRRFIWLNLITGFAITMVLLYITLA